jgi:hypothetical protein
VTFLFCYLVLDLYFFPSPLSRSFYSPISKLKTTPPENFSGPVRELTSSPLLEAINKNGLAMFLLVRFFPTNFENFENFPSWLTKKPYFGTGKRVDGSHQSLHFNHVHSRYMGDGHSHRLRFWSLCRCLGFQGQENLAAVNEEFFILFRFRLARSIVNSTLLDLDPLYLSLYSESNFDPSFIRNPCKIQCHSKMSSNHPYIQNNASMHNHPHQEKVS